MDLSKIISQKCSRILILNTELRFFATQSRILCSDYASSRDGQKESGKINLKFLTNIFFIFIFFNTELRFLRRKAELFDQTTLVALTARKTAINSIDRSDAWRFEYAESATEITVLT